MGQVLYEFTVGVSVWMIYAVVAAIVVIVMGLFRYKRDGYSGTEIVPCLTQQTLTYVIVVMMAFFYIMLVTGEMFDLGSLSFVVLILAVIAFGALLYLMGYVAGLIKLGWLYERVKLQRAKNERAKAIRLQRYRERQEEEFRREARKNVEKKKRNRQQSIETRLPRI